MNFISQMAVIISLLLGIVSLSRGVIMWIRSATIKRYAAERDFAHLQRNYEALQGYFASISDELEDIRSVLVEIKVLVQLRNAPHPPGQ